VGRIVELVKVPVAKTHAASPAKRWLSELEIAVSTAKGLTAALSAADPVTAYERMGTTSVEQVRSIEPCDAASARMLRNALSNGWIPAEFEGYCPDAD
jgi:hypothetical protein